MIFMALHKKHLYILTLILLSIICMDKTYGQAQPNESIKPTSYFLKNHPNIFHSSIDSFKTYYVDALNRFSISNDKESQFLSAIYLSDLHRIERNSDSCKKYLKLAYSIDYKMTNINDELSYEINNILHSVNYYLRNYQLSIAPAKVLLKIFNEGKNHSVSEKLLIYDQLSTSYNMTHLYDSAITYLDKSDSVIELLTSPDTSYLIKNAYKRSYILHIKGLSEYALKKLLNATILINNNKPSYYTTLIYSLIGNIYHKFHQFDKAVSYYKQELENYKTLGYPEHPYFSYTYNSLSTSLNRMGRTREALDYIKKCIKIENANKDINVIYSYQSLAVIYLGLDSLKLADKYYRKSIDLLDKHHQAFAPVHRIDFLRLYGRFKLFQLNDPSGMEILREAIIEYQNLFGNRYHQISQCYNLIANSKIEHENNPDSALFYYQKALITNDLTFSNSSIAHNPEIKNSFSKVLLFKTLQNKSNALLIKSKHEKGADSKVYYLNLAQQSLLATAGAIDHIRNSFSSMDSKLKINEESADVYAKLISSSFNLYDLTDQSIYLELAYEFVEKSKLSTLNGLINEVGAKISGNVPAEILSKEKELNIRRSELSDKIYKAKQGNKDDSLSIKELFIVDKDIDVITNQLEDKYDRYYELKYQNTFLKLDSLQQMISDKQVVIEYYLSDTSIIEFVITKDSFKVITIGIDDRFRSDINAFTSHFNNNLFIGFDERKFEHFKKHAYKLYQLLIGQVELDIQGKELIIIPDKILLQIPFEALITNLNLDSKNYRKLDYLIKSHPISYAYSTEWLFDQQKKKTAKKNLLSIVPSYDENIDYENLILQNNLRPNREILSPLPGAIEETENINKSIKSKILRAEDATELNFKKLAKNYSILHFAMHTIIDDNNPMFSKLVFAPSDSLSIGQEDNLLNTHEIFNLELNAQLVSLSSCKSGFGQLKKGEGVMSMARGFMFAGCPSLVITLWSIDDQASTELMSLFYEYLADGYSKSKAMQMAKVQILSHSDPILSHPLFWASHIIIGDPEELQLNRNQNHFYLIIAILFFLTLALIFRKKFIGVSKLFLQPEHDKTHSHQK